MPAFHVADLSAQGELELKAQYDYEDLQQLPGAADLIGIFSGRFWQTPNQWELDLAPYALHVRFTSPAPTAGIATLRERDKILSLSLLLTGINPDADQVTLGALQSHILRELHSTPFEAGFSLLQLKERPLVASVHLSLPANVEAHPVFAIADRCLAAAYFRYHRLA